jgi:hypothetical protein
VVLSVYTTGIGSSSGFLEDFPQPDYFLEDTCDVWGVWVISKVCVEFDDSFDYFGATHFRFPMV